MRVSAERRCGARCEARTARLHGRCSGPCRRLACDGPHLCTDHAHLLPAFVQARRRALPLHGPDPAVLRRLVGL